MTWSSVSYPAETLEKPDVIESPIDWALGYFLISQGDGSHIVRTQLDLDNDGVAELFLGWPSVRGRNGMPFVVFKKSGRGYSFLGELFVREDFRGLKVLPPADNDQLRFAQYWAHGGCEGTIQIFTHDGVRFKAVESEQGNMRLREIFGE